PERPIPSGLISKSAAAALGLGLLLAGVFSGFRVSPLSGALALAIAVAALVYDRWGKHHDFLGPLNMGLCRGLNLLLGVSIIVSEVREYWFLALVPILYIAAITMISRGEVHGGRKATLWLAVVLYALAMA